MEEASDNDKNDQIKDIDKIAEAAGVDNSENNEPGENETSNEDENGEDKEVEKEIKDKPSDDIKVNCHICTFNAYLKYIVYVPHTQQGDILSISTYAKFWTPPPLFKKIKTI